MNRAPRTFDWLPAVDAPPAVEVAERLILAEETFFGDDPPQWLEGRHKRPCQSAAEAQAYRLQLVKRLRRFGQSDPKAELVALRLENCAPNRRCRSGACSECARAWQRWFVTATSKFLTETSSGGQSTILSPVHPEGLVEHGELNP